MDHPSSEICDKSGSLPKQKMKVAGTANATSNGPLINLLQNKKPPVSMHLMGNTNQKTSSMTVVSSSLGFNSG